MPTYKDIYYADNSTALSIAAISAAEATSTGDAIESLKLDTPVPVADTTARAALFPSPVQGNAVWRLDKGWEERYYAAYNSMTNPGGAATAGWYPVNGMLPKLSVITSTAQTISTATAITFGGTLTQDIENNITFTKSTGTVTVTQPGMYKVSGGFVFNATTSGSKTIGVYKNSTAVLTQVITTAVLTPFEISLIVKCASNDTLNIYGSANTATATVVGGAAYFTHMQVEYMGPAQ
jgi:hypothetical protein